MDSLALLQSVRDRFDAESLRFPQERQLLDELKRDSSVNLSSQGSGTFTYPLPWDVAEGVVCNEEVFGNLHRVGALVRRVLRLQVDLRVRLYPYPFANALPIPGNTKDLTIAVTAAVLERFWLPEAVFLIGRAVAMHQMQPCLLTEHRRRVSDDSRLQRLGRYQELFADRVGLICCQDIAVAKRAIVRIETGLADPLLPSSLTGYSKSLDPAVCLDIDSDDFLTSRLGLLNGFFYSTQYGDAFHCHAAPQTPSQPLHMRERVESAMGPAAPLEPPQPQIAEWTIPLEQQDDDQTALERKNVRDFSLCSTLWVLSLKDQITFSENELLEDLFGVETLQLWRLEIETKGEAILQDACRRCAEWIRQELDAEQRLAIIRELLSVALAEGPLSPRENDLIVDLASWIGLDEDDLSILAAEHVDPEFAMYRFEAQQLVDVQLDGEWVRGMVEAVNPNGDMRVRFLDDGEVFHLNPVADLVRPILQPQAG